MSRAHTVPTWPRKPRAAPLALTFKVMTCVTVALLTILRHEYFFPSSRLMLSMYKTLSTCLIRESLTRKKHKVILFFFTFTRNIIGAREMETCSIIKSLMILSYPALIVKELSMMLGTGLQTSCNKSVNNNYRKVVFELFAPGICKKFGASCDQ